jgi:transcription antitermination factor NusG
MMATSSLPVGGDQNSDQLHMALAEPAWYAAYTCANHEKRVADQLAERSVEHFLPTFESVRRWKDRKMRIAQPLFPGYVFIRLALRDRFRVLQIPSVVRFIGFGGGPVALADQEIEILRTSLLPELRASPHPYLKVGRKVRIVNGPLEGTEGILLRMKNALRVVISIDLIMRAASVEVDAGDLERV